MDTWHRRILAVLFVGTTVGYAWLWIASPPLRTGLGVLTAVVVVIAGGLAARHRATLTPRERATHVASAALVNLALAGAVVGAERLWALGVVAALWDNGHHFVLGVVGIGGGALLWRRLGSRRPPAPAPVPTLTDPEPAPPALPALDADPPWDDLATALAARGDTTAIDQLSVLRRIAAALTESGAGEAPGRRVVHQEVQRLMDASVARGAQADDDVLSQAAELLKWGTQKLPELADLDVSDVLMAKAIADIRALNSGIAHIFVDHRQLRAIHPIDRPTADDKCDARAEAARQALPVLEANGMRLSEALIAAHPELSAFASVTGFQVVELADGGWVTFEGNGRREALQRAFGDDVGVEVEVRSFQFDDPEVRRTIRRRVQRVRRWKGVV